MSEKLLTFPSPTSPDPGDGVNRSKFKFFQYSITQPNTTKDICSGTPCPDQGIFCQGGVGGRVQAPQLILQFKEGVQWFYYTFSRGVQLFPGVGVQ